MGLEILLWPHLENTVCLMGPPQRKLSLHTGGLEGCQGCYLSHHLFGNTEQSKCLPCARCYFLEHGPAAQPFSTTPTQVLPWSPERFDQDEGTLGLILSSLLGNIVLGHCGYSPENNFSHWGLLLNWSFILPFPKEQAYWAYFYVLKKKLLLLVYSSYFCCNHGEKNMVSQ